MEFFFIRDSVIWLFITADLKPVVTVNPVRLEEPVGQTITFQCNVQGPGPFNIIWSRIDGQQLPNRAQVCWFIFYIQTVSPTSNITQFCLFIFYTETVGPVEKGRGSSISYAFLLVCLSINFWDSWHLLKVLYTKHFQTFTEGDRLFITLVKSDYGVSYRS